MPVGPGSAVGPYRIHHILGSGGMGVVYLAEDERLGRAVAVKFLKAATAQQARERIFHEARAASALNHPHICTVYDVGEHEGDAFLVMESLDGTTLATRLGHAPLPVSTAIHIAIQIADALQAAHRKGIIHRDLKPANVFVTARGDVKVLDFGIAEVNAVAPTGSGTLDAGELATQTAAGGAIGTPLYMSPEQVRGERLDSGTDIYSLGVTLYQMVTGVLPFSDASSSNLFQAIVTRKPPRPSSVNAKVPRGLDAIVLRALDKTRTSRYRDVGEMLADLRALQVRLGRAWRKTAAIALAVGSMAIALTMWIESQRLTRRGVELKQLTNSGRVDAAAISNDGRALTYHDRDTRQIRRQALDESAATVISTDAPLHLGWLQVGPDNRVVYVKNSDDSTIVRLDTTTREARVVAEDVFNLPALSHAGTRLVFGRRTNGRIVVVNASTNGGDERQVLTRAVGAPGSFAWSPDDEKLAMVTQRGIVIVSATGGESTLLSPAGWDSFNGVQWSAPGDRILLLGVPSGSDMVSRSQLLELSYPGGAVHRITNDLADYARLTATADGSIASTIVREFKTKVSVGDSGQVENGRIVPGGRDDGVLGLAWLDDGKLILSDSSSVMWATDPSGSTRTVVLPPNGRGWAVAPCGPHSFAFTALERGNLGVFVNALSSPPRQITSLPTLFRTVRGYPSCTPDGRSMIYTDGRRIQRVNVQTGETVSLAAGHHPEISPDGMSIVYHATSNEGERLIVVSAANNSVLRTLPQPFDEAAMHWSADGQSVIGVATVGGTPNLLRVDTATGATTPMTRFADSQTLFDFAINRGGGFAIARGETTYDIVLIRRP